jgi:mannose-6-phosphate isomerase-like protein (cupin superfamily)
MDKVNVSEKLALFSAHWTPKIIAELNGQHVKLAKLLGEFEWHAHEHEDELFWVISGRLEIELRDRVVVLDPGEFFVVPRGVEHKPRAANEVEVVLFEPVETRHTGSITTQRTVEQQQWI